MRKRLTMIVSGSIAAIVVLAIFLVLVQSSRTSPQMTSPPALREMAVAEPAAPPARLVESPPRPATMTPSGDTEMTSAPPPEATEAAPPTDPIAVSVPQLAYAYVLGYRLPGPRIAEAQQAHLALCRRLGTLRCQLVSMRNGSSDAGYANASLQLRVASAIAQGFRADLTKAIADTGGRPAETNITAEDVSKDVSDTEARIRQREILVARLTEMLRNRRGTVGELVEAERSVAAAQEELDQAKGWLGELRTRIALSQFTINYVPAPAVEPSPRPQSGRLSDAVVASAAVRLAIGRSLLILLIFLAPWVLIGLVGFALVRRWHKTRPAAPAEA